MHPHYEVTTRAIAASRSAYHGHSRKQHDAQHAVRRRHAFADGCDEVLRESPSELARDRREARRLHSRAIVMDQRTTQPIRSEDLVPLLATSAGQDRATARIPAVELAGLVSETRTDLPVLAEVGDMLREELASDDRAMVWRRSLTVIGLSLATTLGIALGYLVAS
jgi:hypothetical protein